MGGGEKEGARAVEEMKVVWTVAGVTVAIVAMAAILWIYRCRH